jgi:hypothetical protein
MPIVLPQSVVVPQTLSIGTQYVDLVHIHFSNSSLEASDYVKILVWRVNICTGMVLAMLLA